MQPSIKFQIRLTYGQLRVISIVVLVLLLFASSASSFAQDAGFQLLDKIDSGFAGKAGQWDAIIRVYANRLFWLLATADFCFMCATFVLDKKEMEDMLASVIRKLMTLGFFWFVLKTSQEWIPQIINSFTLIGQKAGNTTVSSPDNVVVAGYDAALAAFQALSDLGVTEKIGAVFPTVLMALIIFLSFLWVGAQLLIAKIETSIAVGAGIILLGFGGSKWTTDMASKYMQYSVATGLKLMLMFLLIGMGQTLFNDIHIVGGDKFFESLLVTTGTALTYGFLATKIPAIASAMMSGSPSLTAGDMTGAVIGAAAAVAGLGAAGAAAGKAGMGAATGGAAAATGVGQALQAGIASGIDHGKSGGDLAAHAIGEVGKHSMGLATAGIGDMLQGGKSSFSDRVGESAGGRVATSIQAGRGGSMAGVAAPAGGSSATTGATPSGTGAGSGSAAGAPSTSSSAEGQSQPAAATGSESAASAASGAASGAPSVVDDTAAPGAQSTAEPGMPASKSAAADVAKAASAGGVQDAAPAAPASSDPATSNRAGSAASPAAPLAGQASSAVPASPPSALAGNAGTPMAGASGPMSQPSGGAAPVAQPSAAAGNPAATPSAAAPSATTPDASEPAATSSDGAGSSNGDASTGAVTGGNQPNGDASTGAVTGGNQPKNDAGSGDRKPPALHERIRDLQGYVPDDAAHSATFHIDMKHAE